MSSKTRILHLEDVSTDIELLKDKLIQERLEFVIKSVDNRKDFERQLSDYRPDLIISDNKLADINARTALLIVQNHSPDIPVIIVTGTMDEETAVELMKAGAVDYVLKDNLSRLVPAVKNALEKKRMTEEKAEAVKQLRMANERMQYLLFSTSAIIYSANAESLYTFSFLTENVFHMTHFSAEEIISKPDFWMNHIHLEDRERIKEESLIVFEQEKVTHEYRFRRKDKSYIWLRDEKKLVRDQNEEPLEIVGHIINITERKKVERDLRDSEGLYRSVVSSMAEGILVQSADGTVQTWNRRAEQLLGFNKDQNQSKSARRINWQAIHEDGSAFPVENYPAEITFKTGKPCSNVIMGIYNAGNSLTWISVNSQPIFQASELKPSLVVSSVIDITDQMLAEDALKVSEQRFRTVFNNAANGIAIADLDGKLVRVNPAFEKMLGYSVEELGKMIFTDFTHKEDVDKDWNLFKELINGLRNEYFMEKRFLRKDGSILWGMLGVSLIKDDKNTPLYTVGMVEDITERKNAEELLKKSEERYRQFFENDISGDCISSVDGSFIDCNPAFLQIMGFDSIKELNQVDARTYYLKPAERDNIIDLTKKQGRVLNHEVELRNKKGEVVYCIQNVYGIFDDHGQLQQLMEYLFNITDRKKLEVQLVQSQKLEAIGQLAGGIAHDFNNLLTIINGYSEILLKEVAGENKLRKKIDEIRTAGKRAAALTNQLLAFSRRQIVQPRILNPNRSIKNIKKMLTRLINENIRIKTILDDTTANINIDPGQFDQIIINLVVNARDAMPNGGILTIETQNMHLYDDVTQHHLSVKAGDYVFLSVSDTGQGMDEQTRSQIFEPFFTTKQHGKGTGLGLSTVYGIVKQAGGDIWVSSEIEKGSAFKIYFPAVKQKTAAFQEKAPSRDDLRGTETVMVVEDEPAVRELTCEFLTGYGYDVVEAQDVGQAIGLARNSKRTINLVITDIIMPEMSGPELAKVLCQINSSMKVLFVTGYTDSGVVHQSVIEEGVHLLTKPFGPKDLAEKVREILENP